MSALESTVEKINTILNVAGTTVDRNDLLINLKEVLSGFAGLNVPAFKVALYNHIIKESAARCGVTISVEELDRRG